MFKQKLLSLTICGLLVGCSSFSLQSPKDKYQEAFLAPEKASQMLQKKENCCADYRQFTYTDIKNDDTFLIPITVSFSML